MAITFDQLMKGFGVVTVMNATIFEPVSSYYGERTCADIVDENGYYKEEGKAMRVDDFKCGGLYLDTLKIANLTLEGPTKTVTGGQYANPLIKYGKTMTAEIQDALGRADTMVKFFGCEYEGGDAIKQGTQYKFNLVGTGEGVYYLPVGKLPVVDHTKYTVTFEGISGIGAGTLAAAEGEAAGKYLKLTIGETYPAAGEEFVAVLTTTEQLQGVANPRLSVTDKFPAPFAIEGDTYFIDQKSGEKKHVFIFIPQFMPDGIFNLTQDAEGDATVFDLNGTLALTTVTDDSGSRDIFYEIREKSFFGDRKFGA